MDWFKRPQPPIIVSRAPLNERELAGALRVPENNPLYVAILQMIDSELREVRAIATQSVKDHGVLASWVGGMEALERLRARLIEDRAEAMGKEAR